MRIQRIPLEQQLRQLKEGIPAHPEFAASAIRSWAETPLGAYFAFAGWAGEKLAAILGIPPGEAEGMPYREAAARVFGLWQAQGGGEETEEMEEAAVLLAKPFILYARAWNMDNCDHCLYLGGQDPATARYMGIKANRTASSMLGMGLNDAWLFARGSPPEQVRKYDLRSHPKYKRLPEYRRGRAEEGQTWRGP